MNTTRTAAPSFAIPVEESGIQALNHAVQNASGWVHPVRSEMARLIIGQNELVDRLLVALLVNGHVLLEGVPGLAKTLALKSLSSLVHADFKRLQFTPDMLPADIVGTEIFNPRDTRFEVKRGPVFANFILADEINRAPAKVQSALLEAMQEKQVTIGDHTFPLPQPFMVMATQNPLDQEGTYPLPEAQIDRFMLKVVIDYPSIEEERAILEFAGTTDELPQLSPVIGLEEIVTSRRVANAIYMDDKVKDYIVRMVYATREPERFGLDLGSYIRTGASPRATIGLTLAGKAQAFINGRGYVTPQDIKTLAMDVLRHRVSVTYEAEAEGLTSEHVIAKILDTLPVP